MKSIKKQGQSRSNNLFDIHNDVIYQHDGSFNLNHNSKKDENDVTNKKSNGKKERLTYLIAVMMSFTRNMTP